MWTRSGAVREDGLLCCGGPCRPTTRARQTAPLCLCPRQTAVCRRPTALKASAVVDCRRRCWPSCSPCSALTATAQGRRGRQPLPAAAGSVGTGRGNGRYSNPTERCAGTASLNEKTASSPHPEKALEDKRAAWVRSWPHSGFGGRSRPPDAKLDIGEQIISAHIAHRHRPDATGSIHRARPAFEEAATALGVAQQTVLHKVQHELLAIYVP